MKHRVGRGALFGVGLCIGTIAVAAAVVLGPDDRAVDGSRSDVGPREFRVERPRAPQDNVETTLRAVLERVTHGGEVSEAELVRTLVDAMHRENLGIAVRREAAARTTVRQIIDAAAKFGGEHSGSTTMRERALAQQTTALLGELNTAVGHRSPTSAPTFGPKPEGYRRLQWEELTGTAFEAGKPLAQSVKALDGQNVAMAGYLVEGAFDELLLVTSVWGCCFGEPPAIDEAVVVSVDGPTAVPWFLGVVRVVGTLDVGPDYEDGELLSLYRLHAIQVDTLQ